MNIDTRLADLLVEWEERSEQGKPISVEELCKDSPDLAGELRKHIAALQGAEWMKKPVVAADTTNDDKKHTPPAPPAPGFLENLGKFFKKLWPKPRVASPGNPSPTTKDPLFLYPGCEPVPGYELVEPLGEGGYGQVWKATGPGDFPLALKIVSLDKKASKRELRALDVIRNVRHPNLLSLFASWRVENRLVIAMELAEKTLWDRYQEVRKSGAEGIPGKELWEYFREAAKGLDYLNAPHPELQGDASQGIQHRDIKPQNLLLVGGSVKVGDFGLARLLEHSLTKHTGSMTASYAAPEFFKGKTARHSDQYSLAVVYCELRGGRLPFNCRSIHELAQAHIKQAPDLRMVPDKEKTALKRALAKSPKDRWPSCRDFVEALRWW